MAACFLSDKAKNIFFLKKKSKWPTQKKLIFQLPIFDILSWKFHGLVLGLVELIDVKGIGVAQPMRSWGCLT